MINDFDVVPIINENDTVNFEQIKFGDNDTLSAHFASIIKANLLIILYIILMNFLKIIVLREKDKKE